MHSREVLSDGHIPLTVPNNLRYLVFFDEQDTDIKNNDCRKASHLIASYGNIPKFDILITKLNQNELINICAYIGFHIEENRLQVKDSITGKILEEIDLSIGVEEKAKEEKVKKDNVNYILEILKINHDINYCKYFRTQELDRSKYMINEDNLPLNKTYIEYKNWNNKEPDYYGGYGGFQFYILKYIYKYEKCIQIATNKYISDDIKLKYKNIQNNLIRDFRLTFQHYIQVIEEDMRNNFNHYLSYVTLLLSNGKYCVIHNSEMIRSYIYLLLVIVLII